MTASDEDPFADDFDSSETQYAQGRLPGRTYASKVWPYHRANSSDYQQPVRFAYKVFDNEIESTVYRAGEDWVVTESPGGRVQLKLLLAREAGNIKELWIQKVPAPGSSGTVHRILNLKGSDIRALLDFFKVIEQMPIEGGQTTCVDDSVIRQIFGDPDVLDRAYANNREPYRAVIEDDEFAEDVIALARRRQQVALFHRYLEDDAFFDEQVAKGTGRGPEAVWQQFFENNKWILGITLTTQLLTSWDAEKLERLVAGPSVAGSGKRVDALLQTAGAISSFVLAEFKTHRSALLATTEYRAGCWAPSSEVVGGVAQVHGTVHEAVKNFGDRLVKHAEDGSDLLGEYGYALRPKSFLIVGSLEQLRGSTGGHNLDKVRSFELYRRQLQEPEVITYDELLARAQWMVSYESST